MTTIRIKGNCYSIELELGMERLINVDNPKDIRMLKTIEEKEHFKSIVRGF